MAHKNPTNQSPMRPKPAGKRHRKPEKIYDFSEADDRLYDLFRNHGFGDLPHSLRHQFVRFYQLLMQEQENQNFTRLVNLKDVAIKHFVDSMMVPKVCTLQFPLIDMGTGPGFPGIPLKILFPKERIILAEGVQKRVEFLKKVREELKLENLDIIGRNVDEEFLLPVQGVITRAVEDISNTMRNASGCLQTGGYLYFMKGPGVDPEIAAAEKKWAGIYELVRDECYTLPETPHQRRMLVYKKLRPLGEADGLP